MTVLWGLAILVVLYLMRERIGRTARDLWRQLREELTGRRVALGWVAVAGLGAIALAYGAWQPLDVLAGLGIRVMNDTAWFLLHVALPVAALMAIAVVEQPIATAIRTGCAVGGNALADVGAGLGRARDAALGYWRERVAGHFHVMSFLSGLLLLALIPLAAWVQYALLVPTIESLLPVSEGAFEMVLAGHKLAPAQGVAMLIIVAEALAGLVYCELVGLTELAPGFTSRIGRWTKVFMKTGALLALGMLCCIEAELTAWRTAQLQRMDELARSSDDPFALGGAPAAPAGAATTPPAPASALEDLVDRLLPVTMIALGGIVPLVAAVAGIGIYLTQGGIHGAVTAVGVLLPLTLLQGTAVLLSRLAGYVAAFLEAILAVIAGIGNLVYNVLAALWQRIREAGRAVPEPLAARAPDRASAVPERTERVPAADGHVRAAAEEAARPGPGSVDDVLRRAFVDVEDNPLGVPDDELIPAGTGRTR